MKHDDYNRLLVSLRLGSNMGTEAAREVFEYVLRHHPTQARSIALKVLSTVAFQGAQFPAKLTTAIDGQSERLAYSVTEAGRLVGIGKTSMYRHLCAGNLGAVRIDRSTRIPRWALIGWLDSLPVWETVGPLISPSSPRIHPRRPGEDPL